MISPISASPAWTGPPPRARPPAPIPAAALGDYRDIAVAGLSPSEPGVNQGALIGLGALGDRLRQAAPEAVAAAESWGLGPLLPSLEKTRLDARAKAGGDAAWRRAEAVADTVVETVSDVAALPGAVAGLPDQAADGLEALTWAMAPERSAAEREAFWRAVGQGAAGMAAVAAERSVGRVGKAVFGPGRDRRRAWPEDAGSARLEVLARGRYGDQEAYDALEKGRGAPPEQDYWGQARPDWRDSEQHHRDMFKAEKSQPYLGGVRKPRNVRGSSVPDGEASTVFLETKQIDPSNRQSRRAQRKRVAAQVKRRRRNLPLGARQKLGIDVRGSDFNLRDLEDLVESLAKATGLDKGEIRVIIGPGADDWVEYE